MANGYNIASHVGGPPGGGNLDDPRDYYAPVTVHIPRTAANVAFVKSVLQEIDRVPINDLDTAYLNHDLGYVTDNAMTNVVNNVVMGGSVWTVLTFDGGTLDPYGRLYGNASIPFIVGIGSTYNVLTATKNTTPLPPQWVADTVCVTSTTSNSNNIIDVGMTLVSSGTTISTNVSFTSQVWNSFTSALGSTWSNISSSLSGAWDWFKSHIFGSDNASSNLMFNPSDALGVQLSTPDKIKDLLYGTSNSNTYQYVKVSAGDRIDPSKYSEYDDNRDGVIDLNDKIAASLGIVTTNTSTTPGTASLRALTAADAIDVTTGRNTDGSLATLGATKDFYNLVTAVGGDGADFDWAIAPDRGSVALVGNIDAQPYGAAIA